MSRFRIRDRVSSFVDRHNLSTGRRTSLTAPQIDTAPERPLFSDGLQATHTPAARLPSSVHQQQVAQSIAPGERNYTVVVGAGPVGLAAALTLHQQGRKVVVLEKRPENTYSLPIHYNLREDSIPAMRQLGIASRIFGHEAPPNTHAGAIEYLTFRNQIEDQYKISGGQPIPTGNIQLSPNAAEMLRKPSVTQVRRSDIEKALYAEVKAAGIEVIGNAEVKAVHDSLDGTMLVEAGPEGQRRTQVLTPEMVVGTDGAHSDLRSQLGIGSRELSQRAYYISGLLNVDVGGTLTRRVDRTKNGENIRQLVVGHASNGQAWTLIELPERKLAKLDTPKKVQKYYLKHAQRAFYDVPNLSPRKLSAADIAWGGQKTFSVVQREVDTVNRGAFYFLGDAAGGSHFATSGGINTAFAFHLPALASASQGLLNGGNIPSIRELYDARVLSATAGWREVGAGEFVFTTPINFGQAFTQNLNDTSGRTGTFNDIRPVLKAAQRGMTQQDFNRKIARCPNLNAVDADGNSLGHHIAMTLQLHPERIDWLSSLAGTSFSFLTQNRNGQSTLDIIREEVSRPTLSLGATSGPLEPTFAVPVAVA